MAALARGTVSAGIQAVTLRGIGTYSRCYGRCYVGFGHRGGDLSQVSVAERGASDPFCSSSFLQQQLHAETASTAATAPIPAEAEREAIATTTTTAVSPVCFRKGPLAEHRRLGRSVCLPPRY